MLFHREKNKKNRIKKRRLSSEPVIPRLHTSLEKVRNMNCGRVSLYIPEKRQCATQASLTVEAAVILPLFLIAMLTLVCVIDVCRIHVEQQFAAAKRAEKLAIYACAADENLGESYIDLYQVYSCELPVSLIPRYKIDLAIRGRVHAWSGRSEEECLKDKEETADEMVYVTENKEVYHTSSECTHLELSIYTVAAKDILDARNTDGGKYYSCEKCCGASDKVNFYYISTHGHSYHTSRDCSGLTRTVEMVRKTEVAHLPCCSRCKGG